MYLPIILTILYGRFWKAVDDEIKKRDAFCRLNTDDGALASRTISLEYHGFWSPLSILQALRYRHWIVAVSSTGLVLGSIVIPISQNYLFQWEIYSGGRLEWNVIYSWQVGTVDSRWSTILTAELSVALCCSLALLWLLPIQNYPDFNPDVTGIAAVIDLVHEPLPVLDEDTNCMTALEIDAKLENYRLRVVTATNSLGLVLEEVHSPPNSPSPSSPSSQPPQPTPSHSCLQSFLMFLTDLMEILLAVAKRLYHAVNHYIVNPPTAFVFRREVFTVWLLGLIVLMCFTIFIAATMDGNAKDNLWNYTLPLSSNLYFVLGIFILVCFIHVDELFSASSSHYPHIAYTPC